MELPRMTLTEYNKLDSNEKPKFYINSEMEHGIGYIQSNIQEELNTLRENINRKLNITMLHGCRN